MSFSHLRDVLDEVAPLGQLFADAGYRLFLVGGIVRDQWLDEPLDASSDIDLTTNALPAETKRIVAAFADDLWSQGERFGTIGLRAGGRDYEVTTHRAESYTSESRKPIVSFGDNIDTDLSRRDFTVNAMAIELPDGELVDPYGGVVDLDASLLRTPLSAEISFTDDPLRMLRAARFAAKYSLAPTPDLHASAVELHQRLRIVAIERIGVEMRRLLGLPASPVGLRFLADTGLLAEVLSYGEPSLIDEIQPRLQRAIEIVAASPRDWHLALAGIGLAVFDDDRGVQAMCQRLRLSRDDERAVVSIAQAATGTHAAPNLGPPAMRRWIAAHVTGAAIDFEPIKLAFRLNNDAGGEAPFLAALADLASSEDVHNVTLLDGDVIMQTLGVPSGPVVGQARAFLQESYFEHGPTPSDAQIVRLKSWLADRETNT